MHRFGDATQSPELARERAFAAFVEAHRDRAVGIAWRLVGGDAAAEDIAQEAFVRAYRALGSLREESRLPGWFYRILLNEVQRYRRWRWVRQRLSGEMILALALPADADPDADLPDDYRAISALLAE
jgi:RNA polymerase sigma factor (sigma-70 family)